MQNGNANNQNFQDFLDELKSRLEIVSVVSRYIPLEKKGRNFWGLCPFHHEKTPSFSVNPEGNFYHCFGCSASGDSIGFVKEIEGVDFIGALKILAPTVGMQVPEIEGRENLSGEKEKRDKLLALLKDAANYYHLNLKKPAAEEANKYILKRGLASAAVKNFGLGYSLGFNEIIDYLKAKGYTLDEMYESGVADRSDEGRTYDALGGRLIFPICDNMGQVVAFGGRLLEKKDFAKYKNTRETMLFVKNKTLYGLHLVKKLKVNTAIDGIIMVEGYMDCIALSEAGFKNTVASMGTSLTTQQARLIKRYSDKVYISYDGDAAGQKATIRGLELLYEEGLDVRVVTIPDELDPDDLIRKSGAPAYQALLNSAKPLVEYKLQLVERTFDLNTVEGRGKYAYHSVRVLKSLRNEIEMQAYLQGIADKSAISVDILKQELKSTGEEDSKVLKFQPPERKKSVGAYEKAERYILNSMLYGKPFVKRDIYIMDYLDDAYYAELYEYILAAWDAGKNPAPAEALDNVRPENKDKLLLVLEYEDMPDTPEKEKKYYIDSMTRLVENYHRGKISELCVLHDRTEDKEQKKQIMAEVNALKQKMKSLKEVIS